MTQQPNYASPMPGQKTNGLALTSMILGIVCYVFTCIPYLNFIIWAAAIAAIVLGLMARKQIAQGQGSGAGMAMAGIILGIIYLVIYVILIILVLVVGVTFFHFAQQQQQRMQQNSATSTTSEIFHYTLNMVLTVGRCLITRG